MAEGVGLEPTRPKPPVFKTGALPIRLTFHRIVELRHSNLILSRLPQSARKCNLPVDPFAPVLLT